MRRTCLSALALLLAVQLGAESAKPPAKGPRIAVEPGAFDFGKALKNRSLTKEFSIRNFGTEDLVIENVSTTCGCTAALADTKVVKPGASTPLRVTLETRNYSGHVERKVLIKSNDSAKATYEVKVEATVVPDN